MTIFDTIRYPIPDRPTTEQLRAVPNEIMIELNIIVRNKKIYHFNEKVALLRKMIAEYEPI